ISWWREACAPAIGWRWASRGTRSWCVKNSSRPVAAPKEGGPRRRRYRTATASLIRPRAIGFKPPASFFSRGRRASVFSGRRPAGNEQDVARVEPSRERLHRDLQAEGSQVAFEIGGTPEARGVGPVPPDPHRQRFQRAGESRPAATGRVALADQDPA